MMIVLAESVQRCSCRGSAEVHQVHKWTGAEVLRCCGAGAEVQMQRCRCKGAVAEAQHRVLKWCRSHGAEVVQTRWTGAQVDWCRGGEEQVQRN